MTYVLQKDRHPNLDFFIADLTTWNLKDDQASMEHPMFSLAKSPDTSIRRYTYCMSRRHFFDGKQLRV